MEKGFYLRSGSKRFPKPESSSLPDKDRASVKTESNIDSVYNINEIDRKDVPFDFKLNRENILQGIIFAEVFGKPKGISYWKR